MRAAGDRNLLVKEYWQIKADDEKRQLAIARIAKEAAELVHCAVEAQEEVAEVEQALANNEYVEMWMTLQKFLARYWQFIIGTSPITNIMVVPLTKDMMKVITLEALRHQLQLVIGFVYVCHAMKGVRRIAFEECFNKLLKGVNR